MRATFAAGCFWGVQVVFDKVPGVVSTVVGYTGGHLENPTYQQVCKGNTGHAEAIQVEFDQSIISYEKLLDIFWASHNPTTLNRQGPDIGAQYRSAIFYHDEAQKLLAIHSKDLWQANKIKENIVTEITEAGPFYPAEDYHQKYHQKRGESGCPV